MPVIKSAKKKLRQDKKRQVVNKGIRNLLKSLIKKAKLAPSAATIQAATKVADKAAKKNVIHDNKAARIKSRLSKLTASDTTGKTVKKPIKAKKTPQKSSKISKKK